jgi:hypothetical protein
MTIFRMGAIQWQVLAIGWYLHTLLGYAEESAPGFLKEFSSAKHAATAKLQIGSPHDPR